jgi:hypothetical protein
MSRVTGQCLLVLGQGCYYPACIWSFHAASFVFSGCLYRDNVAALDFLGKKNNFFAL